MKLSELQQYILKQCHQRGRLKKSNFLDFYQGQKIKSDMALKDIVKSLDRLVARDLLKASGVKTAKKWYTESVILTSKGKKMAQKLLDKQQKLPLKVH